MKKFLLAAAMLCGALSISAQTGVDPNRLLVISPTGSFKSHMIERVEAIEFRTVDGPAAAEIQISSATLTSVKLTTTMTPACRSYLINIYPAVIAKQLAANPAGAFSYMAQTDSPQQYEDFTSGELSGFEELNPNTEYSIVTAGYDEYGTECDVRVATFTTPSLPLQGDPKVSLEVTDRQYYSISADFTANSDVDGYSVLIGEKGELEKQFEMFAGMFGFSNYADMIKAWGFYTPRDEECDHTWTGLEPNKIYEVYVQCWDKAGVAAPYQVFEVATAIMGGQGEALVDVKIGDYRLEDWNGEQLPSLFVTYTPNDQAGGYRMMVQYAEKYDQDPEGYESDLCSYPEMPIVGWFQYKTISTDYQINPNTEIVVLAAAKNADNKWGKVTKVRYRTPDKAMGAPAKLPASDVKARMQAAPRNAEGMVRGANRGLTLKRL